MLPWGPGRNPRVRCPLADPKAELATSWTWLPVGSGSAASGAAPPTPPPPRRRRRPSAPEVEPRTSEYCVARQAGSFQHRLEVLQRHKQSQFLEALFRHTRPDTSGAGSAGCTEKGLARTKHPSPSHTRPGKTQATPDAHGAICGIQAQASGCVGRCSFPERGAESDSPNSKS